MLMKTNCHDRIGLCTVCIAQSLIFFAGNGMSVWHHFGRGVGLIAEEGQSHISVQTATEIFPRNSQERMRRDLSREHRRRKGRHSVSEFIDMIVRGASF